MRQFFFFLLSGLLVFPLGCAVAGDGGGQEKGGTTGMVTRVEIEGGFFGIVGDDGKRYDPQGLPEEFKQDQLRVRFWPEESPNTVSFRMWGKPIRLKKIEKV